MPNITIEKIRKGVVSATLMVSIMVVGTAANAGAREQAMRLHNRLAAVPPTGPVLADMEADILAGDPQSAAFTAMQNSGFYNVTLKNMAAPWTNRDQTVFVPLNDYMATFIGMVRDDVPFNTALSADMVYLGTGVQPGYSMTSNAHYETMEQQGVDLKDALVQRPQSQVTDLPANAAAGLITTRAAAQAFFIAGTNRAMFRFTLMNHLCLDLEQVHNTSYPPDRIRQDVSRSPGGDSRVFLNNCIGCHNGMDPMAQAFAYYDYDDVQGRITYSAGQVVSKYFNNADNFKYGFATPDDSWKNYWREGQNALLGWDQSLPGSGQGAQSLGRELGNSTAFAECQVQKVFKNVCFRDPVDGADRAQITSMVSSFKNSNYRMKQVFADAAVYCMGD